ncbi:MAG TPA: BamA/TamA family outer membrane protein, partial [Hyphomicrobiaceae bacterium]|nr:BamA/TamA family outer membrane protein [Hyphomicrobiaceae bacterium]
MPGMISRYSGLRPGRAYSAKDLKKAGERLRKLDAIESVRISHGKTLDASGGVPINFAVTERKARFIGAAVSMSTVDGGELQAYWGHRNLFGQAERLKVEGSVSQIGRGSLDALQYMAKTTFTIPAILDIDTDLVTEFRAAKERPETYESRSAKLKIGLLRRFSETLTGTIAASGMFSKEEDAFGTSTHGVLTLPAGIVRDTRDHKLDPQDGIRASLDTEPGYDFYSSAAFLMTRAQISGYQSLDQTNRLVLAGRIGAGSIVGADVQDIPVSMRFFAGGSGSARGYAYRSVGPRVGGSVIGGLGLAEASLELRWRATSAVGLVAFVDAASISPESYPTFEDFKVGVGAGLRYYTSLGPIRLDLAVPINDSLRFSDLALYVGLGQAF